MKTIKVEKLKNYRGAPLLVTEFDANGDPLSSPVTKRDGTPVLDGNGQPMVQEVFHHGDILDVIDLFLLTYPRQKMNMKIIAEATKVLGTLSDARATGELKLEDSSFDWLVAQLKDVGAPIFGLNLPNILAALDT